MDKKEQHALLLQIFDDLQKTGKIRTQGDFAQLLGMTRNYVSRALNGYDAALTPLLMSKAVALHNELIKGEAPVETHHGARERNEAPEGIVIPRETLALYESLAKTAENLTAIVARLMPGALPTPIQPEDKKSGISPE